MTLSRRSRPRMPVRRNRLAAYDLLTIQRASSVISDLDAELDAKLEHEANARERLRLLRETTNQITRAANDAVQAYRRASRAVNAELEKPNANITAAKEMRAHLGAARRELLGVLDVASRRYPWAGESVSPAIPQADVPTAR